MGGTVIIIVNWKPDPLIIVLLLLAAAAVIYFVSTSPPAPISNETIIVLSPGERYGSLLVQKIFSDRIEGINFPDYPISSEQGHPITLRIGETASNGCNVFMKLKKINADSAEFIYTEKQPPYECPICLSGKTMIDTPLGLVNVKELKSGMSVWSTDEEGNKIAAIILRATQTSAPSTHHVIHLLLEDGRELFVSPRHPLSNGAFVQTVHAGDILDGSRVLKSELVPYMEASTYDILPSGETGSYWANGIPMKSTLFK